MIRTLWDRLHTLPGGRRLFSILLGWIVPYSGTIRPRVLELRPGYAKVAMDERRKLRNHLGSIHAIALMNLAELTTGLALNFALPSDARAIVLGLSIEYRKKARGRVMAEASAPIPHAERDEELEIETRLLDGAGEVVAHARARWRVGPRPAR